MSHKDLCFYFLKPALHAQDMHVVIGRDHSEAPSRVLALMGVAPQQTFVLAPGRT